MISIILWALPPFLNPPEQRETTERLVPAGFEGNYWGPEATSRTSRRQDAAGPAYRPDGQVGPVGP